MIPTTSSLPYAAWVYSVNANGIANYNGAVVTATFNGCTGSQPTGTITATPNPCTISSGASTCTTKLVWSTTNDPATACVFYSADQNGASGRWCLSDNTATPYYPNWITTSGITFTLRTYDSSSAPVLGSVVAKGSCVSGTTWSSSSGTCVGTPTCAANYGNSCSSAANACGQVGTGTYLCDGTCSASTPSNAQCLPTPGLIVSPNRVRSGNPTTLLWSCTNATSYTLTGQNGYSTSGSLGGGGSGTNSSGTITAQTNFTLTCTNSSGSSSAGATVFLLPSYIEQ